MPLDLPLVLYRDLLLCTVYVFFLKWTMIQGNGFVAISCFIFVSPKLNGCIYTIFSAFLGWII